MREKLEAQIKALLDRHRKQEHSRRAAVILSACMVFCVIAALMNPAAAMTNPGSITIAADDSSASLTVTASAADADSTFMIKTILTNAALSDSVAFDENNQAVLTDKNGTQITLTRVTAADGSAEYSFTLAAGAESAFTLPFTSVDSSTAGTVAAQSAWGTDLASAEDALAKAENTVSLSLAAMAAETTDSATAEAEETVDVTSAAKAVVLSTANDKSAGNVDFGQYITAASVQKIVDGKWVDASGTVTDGDQVKVFLTYKIGSNIVNSDNRTITYQLPEGLYPDTAASGTVLDNGNTAVGTYTISTTGLITIVFNNDFTMDSNGFTGTIKYEGTASLNGSSTQKTVTFGNNAGSVVIKPSATKNNLVIDKTGTLSSDKSTISYLVKATSTLGTGTDTVTISDSLLSSTATGSYNTSSFRITKTDSSGKETPVSGYSPKFSNGSFTISNLPALAAGEYYSVAYTVAATPATSGDGYSTLANYASATTSGGISNGKRIDVEVSKQMISKWGSYDAVTQKITWTMTVNTNGGDLSGYTISDTLGGQKLSGEITIKDASGTVLATATAFPYKFPTTSTGWGNCNKTGTYTVTYQIDAPSTDTSVTNKADLTSDGKDYSGSATVGVVHQKGTVSKSFTSESGATSAGALYQWNATITVPEAGLAGGDSLTYTDTIKDAVNSLGEGQGSDTHYAVASELATEISSSLTPSSGLSYVLTCYDASGNVVTDDATKVKSYKVIFTATSAITSASKISFSYKTHADYTGIATGNTWTYENDAKAYNVTSKATHAHTKYPPVDKQSGVLSNSAISYSSGNSQLSYSAADGKLYYRLLIRTDASTTGDIVLSDTLPVGTSLDTSSVGTKFYVNDYYSYNSIGYDDTLYDLSANKKPTVSASDGSFTITIPDGYNANCGTDYRILAVTYTLNITNQSFWDNLKNTKDVYTNTVTWGANTAEQKTEVDRDVKNVQKTGEQVVDSDGKPTNVVQYSVIINPAGNDLDASSDTLILTDTLTTASGTAELLPDAIKLYNYDGTSSNGIGTEIGSALYSYTYDQTANKLIFRLPDATPCVVVYQYYIDRGSVAGDITVSNSVSLKGSATDTATEKTVVKDSKSSATAHKAQIVIYKVDSQDFTTTLPNAKFGLKYYNGSDWVQVTAGADSDGNYITNKNGQIVFDLSNTDSTALPLSTNTLYCLTENTAPSGYVKDKKDIYFVWMIADATKASTISKMNSEFSNAKVSTDDVLFLPNSGGAVYVSNTYSSVTVNKKWMTASGTEITDTSKLPAIKLQLYQQAVKPDGYSVTVTVSAQEYEKTLAVVVAKNSSLTIALGPNMWPTKPYILKVNNTELASIYQTNGTATYTISEVTSDMAISVTNDDTWAKPNIAFSNYTAPAGVIAASDKVPYGESVTISSADKWTNTWYSVPKTDTAGNDYQYTVVETSVSGFVTSYANNEGIQTGSITVVNTSESYKLPSTGGIGIVPFWILGLLLMAVPLRLLMRRHMHEGGGG